MLQAALTPVARFKHLTPSEARKAHDTHDPWVTHFKHLAPSESKEAPAAAQLVDHHPQLVRG